jgi:uncharacterized protein (TIGR01777 family)
MTRTEIFTASSPILVSPADLYAWHARPGAFARLQPPWERVELLEQTGGIAAGAHVRLRAKFGPRWLEWIARHEVDEPGRRFVDVQERGPFAAWRHEHGFTPDPSGDREASMLTDRVTYRLPGGPLGRALGAGVVRRKLERMFRYRHAVTRDDLALWRGLRHAPRMKIAITGATGLVGSALAPLLTTQGHEVVRFSRGHGAGLARWNPARHEIDLAALHEVDAVIHLAGANVADGRWTAARRRELVTSRVDTTRWLVEVLGKLERRPAVFVSASATGYYGDTGDATVDEHAPAGSGFLAGLCRDWEAAALGAEAWGARVVLARIGVVLTPMGGALAKLLPVFRAGLGGRIGHGQQGMSWIALDDVLGALAHLVATNLARGPFNLVAPVPVTNAEFTRTLARVLGRPAVLPVPAALLRLAVGAMADEALLASSRVRPARLAESGYSFRAPDLAVALRHVLGK